MDFSNAMRLLRITVLSVGLSLVAFCTAAAAGAPDVSGDLLTPGKIVVGTDSPYPPFEFGQGSELDGYDIDLVDALADELDLEVEYRDTAFDTIFTSLARGKFDLVASATVVTRERKRVVKFMKPNFDIQQSLVVRRGSRIKSIRQLAGLRVGAQAGTNGQTLAENRTPAGEVIDYPNGPRVIRALKRKEVDAVILDRPVAHKAVERKRNRLVIRKNVSQGEVFAYAVRKSSNRLLRGLNSAFAELKADGTYTRIHRKWFGYGPPARLMDQ